MYYRKTGNAAEQMKICKNSLPTFLQSQCLIEKLWQKFINWSSWKFTEEFLFHTEHVSWGIWTLHSFGISKDPINFIQGVEFFFSQMSYAYYKTKNMMLRPTTHNFDHNLLGRKWINIWYLGMQTVKVTNDQMPKQLNKCSMSHVNQETVYSNYFLWLKGW